jgi:hypothetical protein
MSRTAFNMTRTLALVVVTGVLVPQVGLGQQTLSKVLSSEIAISRERAEIQLELEGGRKITAATMTPPATGASSFQRAGTASGDQIFTLGVTRGDAVDRSWREMLNAAMEVPPELLPGLLRDWKSPTSAGALLDAALDSALLGGLLPVTAATGIPANVNDDSVIKLETRIQQLEAQLDNARDNVTEAREQRGPDWAAPFRRVWRGIAGIFGLLITYVVLFGIGFVAILFGARKYLEGVADTVRGGVGRSFLVGLAGSFLLIPVFVLGCIALAISIVGIPALLVWVPLFPVAAVGAALLGFLGTAHAAGESWAERNYYGSDWFRRGNSYYFMMTGLLLLGALFFAAKVIYMAGPWLDFINAILNFFGIVLTWAAVTTGFGAVLISRGGSRPANPAAEQASLFTEDANA